MQEVERNRKKNQRIPFVRDYFLQRAEPFNIEMAPEFARFMVFTHNTGSLTPTSFSESDLLVAAAKSGALDTLQWAATTGLELYEDVFDAAVATGDLTLLEFLRDKCPWSPSIWAAAVLGGHTNAVLWLQNENKFGEFRKLSCVEAAIKSHNLDMFKLVYDKNAAKSEQFLTVAIAEKQWEIVSILLQDGYNLRNEDCPVICGTGNFTLLLQAHASGCRIGADSLEKACSSGNLEMIQWLRTLGIRYTLRAGTAAQNFELLKWMHQDGCPLRNGAIVTAIWRNDLEMVHWILNNYSINESSEIAHACAQVGNVELMDFLWQKYRDKMRLTSIFDFAVRGGNLNMLQWAKNRWIPWNKSMTATAAQYDRIDVLEWLYRNGYFKDGFAYNTLEEAASSGHLRTVKWLVEHGANLPAYFPFTAMYNGHLNVLKYLHSKQKIVAAPDEFTLLRCKHPRVVRWIIQCFQNKS